jgi:DNA polymerase-1
MTWVLDFETWAITDGHGFPQPVGLAIQTPDGARHYAEGRQTMARWCREAAEASHRGIDVVMHNGVGFDLGVAAFWLDVPLAAWNWAKVQDTLVLHACTHPGARHGLKAVAVELLGEATDEADDLREWVMENVKEAQGKPRTWKGWRAFVAHAPRALREPYARADVALTAKLWARLQPYLRTQSHARAYRRLVEAAPLLLQSTIDGIRVPERRMSRELAQGDKFLAGYDKRLRDLLGAPDLDLDSDALGEALRPHFDPGAFVRTTPTGKISTAKGALLDMLPPGELRDALLERSLLATILRTFVGPWFGIARATDGRIRTSWRLPGAITGRLSSSPNFQNIVSEEKVGSLPFPHVRSFVLPEAKHLIVGADFSQQELRLLAHFEAGPLLKLYQQFPDLDVHEAVRMLIQETAGADLSRKVVKVVNFCTIYGGGNGAVAAQAGITVDDAADVRAKYFRAMPSIRSTMRAAEACGMSPGHVTTLGGRDLAAPAREYALLNYLIQGSAADQTYEVLRLLWAERANWWSFRLTVHDEFVLSVVREYADEAKALLRRVMLQSAANLGVACPFQVDTYAGPNWADLKKG